MNSSPDSQMNVAAQAAANTLSDERSTWTIHAPCTGDVEIDLCAVVIAAVDELHRMHGRRLLTHDRIASIMDYLAKRSRDYARQEQEDSKKDTLGPMIGKLEELKARQQIAEEFSKMRTTLAPPAHGSPITTAGKLPDDYFRHLTK